MPHRKEELGVDAGLMSFIQDTHRKSFDRGAWVDAVKVPVQAKAQYLVSVEMSGDGLYGAHVEKLKIARVYRDGNFTIEKGCTHIIISDPCYILQDKYWTDFCDTLHKDEQYGRKEPMFIDHRGVQVAVSSSGHGDGCYDCDIETDDAGLLEKATITFV